MPGNLTIYGCVFTRNQANDGSSIYYQEINQQKLTLESTSFYQNIAFQNGAALYISNSSDITIKNCTFKQNTILIETNKMDGSVVYLNNPGNLDITSSSFENNVGIMGTCIFYSEESKLKLFFLI